MTTRQFRAELDVYESTLVHWVKFTVSICRMSPAPNRLEVECGGKLWLLYQVPDGEPIKCVDGDIVRILKLGFDDSEGRTVH